MDACAVAKHMEQKESVTSPVSANGRKKGKRNMHIDSTIKVCEICGAESTVKHVAFRRRFKQTLCDKHFEQMRKYGKITNSSPRGCFDKNDFKIVGDLVYMSLYDRQERLVGETVFDLQFLDDVMRRKWRPVKKANKLYVATISDTPGRTHDYLHRFVAELSGMELGDKTIDHIDGDSLNNRIQNLRLLTTQEQKLNLGPRSDGKIQVRGVSYSKRDNNYVVDMIVRGERFYCKRFKTIEEAAYARFVFERELIADYSLVRSMPFVSPYIDRLPESTKIEIEKYVKSIIERHKT